MTALTGSAGPVAATLHPSADEQGACQLCAGGFGRFTRAHHCRRCQRLVCDRCSSATLPFATRSDSSSSSSPGADIRTTHVRRYRACRECVAAFARTECASSTCRRAFSIDVARVSCGVCWRCYCERCVAFSLRGRASPISACLECTAWRILYRSGTPSLALERADDARRRADGPRRALAYERRLREKVRAADIVASAEGRETKVDGDDDHGSDHDHGGADHDDAAVVAVPEMRPLAAVLSESEERSVVTALGTIDAERETHDARRVADLLQSGVDAAAHTERFVRDELTRRGSDATGVDYLQQTVESAADRVRTATVEVDRADRLHASVLPTTPSGVPAADVAADALRSLCESEFAAARLTRRLLNRQRLQTAVQIGALIAAFGVVASRAGGRERIRTELARFASACKTRCTQSTLAPTAVARFQAVASRAVGVGVGVGSAKPVSSSTSASASAVTDVLARLFPSPVIAGFAPLLLRFGARVVAQRARASAVGILVMHARAHAIRVLVSRAAARRDRVRSRQTDSASANSPAA